MDYLEENNNDILFKQILHLREKSLKLAIESCSRDSPIFILKEAKAYLQFLLTGEIPPHQEIDIELSRTLKMLVDEKDKFSDFLTLLYKTISTKMPYAKDILDFTKEHIESTSTKENK